MTNRAIVKLGLAALLTSAAASGARADVTSEIAFQGTLSNLVGGGTSVSGNFGFDFTTDAVTSYMFTAPGDGFDSTINNSSTVFPFTSGGTPYINLQFVSADGFSNLELVFNPEFTEFFTLGFTIPSGIAVSQYICFSISCTVPNHSSFASGTVSTVPEPSTWAMILMGFAGLGFAAFRRTRRSDMARAGLA